MMKKEKYNNVVEQYGAKESAQSLVFPTDLNASDKKKADTDLLEVLNNRRAKMTIAQRRKMALLQLRLILEDYLSGSEFDEAKNFGYFLKIYIETIEYKNHELASDINIKPAELSQYINNHRKPPLNIMVRLELHSNNMISADKWYELIEKEEIYKLRTARNLRKEQKPFVNKVVL